MVKNRKIIKYHKKLSKLSKTRKFLGNYKNHTSFNKIM